MRSRTIAFALVVILSSAVPASAQVLSIEFNDGRVRLTAENVSVSRILAEWARVGGTQIVNGERVPGPPVTLQLIDTPEQQAIETVLRGAAGYIVAARDENSTSASALGKILVLPTTSRAPAASALPPPPRPTQFPNRLEQEPEIEEAVENPQGPPNPPGGFPPGVRRLNLPPRPPSEDDDRNDDDAVPSPEPPPPTPGNPFGVIPGGARPGTINAPPPQPNDDQQPR
jgi:hypothetical protein